MAESMPSMNTTDSGFSLPPQGTDPRASAPNLVQRVREVAIRSSSTLFKAALDAADDTLFGFSEKSETAAERGQFMDAMRSIRVKRPMLEQTFREKLTDGFLDFTRRTAKLGTAAAGQSAFAADSLSLVEDQELEEDLAITGMAAKANVRHNSALYALNQRLAAVTGAKEVDVENNPVAPPAICQALRVVVSQIEADITVKLVVLKLFDRHVVTDLDHVYDETNKLLAEAGVLPHIKYVRPSRAPSDSGEAKNSESADGTSGDAASGGNGAGGSSSAGGGGSGGDAGTNEVIAAFASLLATRRSQSGNAVQRIAGPSLSNNELISALSQLQHQQPDMSGAAGDAIALVERVERVKQDLLAQLRDSGIEKADQRVSEVDEDAIDLVSMLFQFVVQDRNLPPEIQAVLSRLQIPYVRVAIKDKRLFAQSEHPARRLLDALATASVSWSKEGDRDGKFMALLVHLVERVAKEYADDFSLFDELLKEFETFVEKQTRQSETVEQRAAEAAKGREKLTLARRTVTQLVEARLARREVPPLAREVILNPWTNYLVLTHLRQGPESNEWKSAVSFIDAVIWSSLPKNEETDLTKLHAMIPQMQNFLRRGLGVVGFGETEIERLAQGFGAVFASMHQREVALDQAETIAAAEQSLENAPPSAAAGAAEPEVAEPAVPEDDEFLQKVRNLKVGTWVEFAADGGATPERAKISWISPLSARLLFVNRKGLKVAEFSVFALANELRAGTAQILEVAPIFERALSSIMTRLKYEHLLASGGRANESAQQQQGA
jgi:hypothetical protein